MLVEHKLASCGWHDFHRRHTLMVPCGNWVIKNSLALPPLALAAVVVADVCGCSFSLQLHILILG